MCRNWSKHLEKTMHHVAKHKATAVIPKLNSNQNTKKKILSSHDWENVCLLCVARLKYCWQVHYGGVTKYLYAPQRSEYKPVLKCTTHVTTNVWCNESQMDAEVGIRQVGKFTTKLHCTHSPQHFPKLSLGSSAPHTLPVTFFLL